MEFRDREYANYSTVFIPETNEDASKIFFWFDFFSCVL